MDKRGVEIMTIESTKEQLAKSKVVTLADTIASGTTTAEFNLKGGTLCGIYTPASISSTSMTITAATSSGGTFLPVRDPETGTAYTITIAASGYYYIPPQISAGLKYLKLVCGSSETSKTFTISYRVIE
jgi:hypothetical protein